MEKEQGAESTLENAEALRKFVESVKYDNGRYEVRLPWKEDQMTIADNYGTAEKRF